MAVKQINWTKDGSAEVSLSSSEEKFYEDLATAKTANAPAVRFAQLRYWRDKKLSKSDWMANSDVTMTDAWKTYRQQLRDLPASYDNTSILGEITWPTEPS